VSLLRERYSAMHRGIIAHDYPLTPENISEIDGMDFVFICNDDGATKRHIVGRLAESGTSFIDVGMGLFQTDGALGGIVRVTTSTPERRCRNERIPQMGGDPDNEYGTNIQIADLNSLNAALAVIKWKKLCGFYLDLEREHQTTFTVDGNALLNED